MRNMLLAMDPPRHVDYRRPLLPSFKAKVIAGLEGRIRTICRQIFDQVGDGDVEFVHDVTSSLPSQVIGELVGLPEEDWPKIHHWAEVNTSGQDRDLNPRGDDDRRRARLHHAHGDVCDRVRRPSSPGGAARGPRIADPRHRVRWTS